MTAVTGLHETVVRVRRGLRRYGAAGALRRAWRLHEHDIWSALELGAERPRRPLAGGLVLRRGGLEDLHRLDGLVHYRRAEAAARLHEWDGRLQLVLDGDALLFVCWIFTARTPVGAAPGGVLELPAGVACLEDSIALPAARGHGIAPATWSRVADDLQAEGFRTLVTKVAAGNAPSRRAVAKAGFVEVAEAQVDRIGPLWRCRVRPYAGEPGIGAELARRLAR